MIVSDEYKKELLSKLDILKPTLASFPQRMSTDNKKYIICPIILDGVFDSIRYNVLEKRFDMLTVAIASRGIVKSDLTVFEGSVFCDEAEFVDIDIPRDWISQ